jgi:hypothetical protein
VTSKSGSSGLVCAEGPVRSIKEISSARAISLPEVASPKSPFGDEGVVHYTASPPSPPQLMLGKTPPGRLVTHAENI